MTRHTKKEFRIFIEGHDDQIPCPGDKSVLKNMEMRGLTHIAVGCRGGGCGVCKVRVISGAYTISKMAVGKVTKEERKLGYALACCLYTRGDLKIRLIQI
ncbi:MAG: ferredoxin [Alphaproteobacteria bacterium]|nr:MAG: ferredoxin [Alphaproteobacteria bacterium]